MLPLPNDEWSPSDDTTEHWSEIKPWVLERKELFHQIREASRLPHLGYRWSDAPSLEDAQLDKPNIPLKYPEVAIPDGDWRLWPNVSYTIGDSTQYDLSDNGKTVNE